MQYRLSTIFLVFFFVAATLALYGAWGIWIAIVLGVAAICLNKAKTATDGAIWAFGVILIGIICPGVLLPASGSAREAPRRLTCSNNLKQIGLGLHNYHDAHKHFPPVFVSDKAGKPLFSWMVAILPNIEYDSIYTQLKTDEPWNSPHNAGILSQVQIEEFICTKAPKNLRNYSTNYLAIIGPGTIWRKEGPVCIKNLPNRSSLTVMAVECAGSDKHWAEPYVLTAEEVLERMKTGKGTRISTIHERSIRVLFADGGVRRFRAEMPISMWRKLLMGEIESEDELDSWQADTNDDPPAVNLHVHKPQPQLKPSEWAFKLSIVVWLISLVMLFRWAWKSREMPVKP